MAYGNYANFDYDRFFIEAMRQLEEQNKREEAEIARLKAQSAASQPKTTTPKTTTPKTTTSTTSEPKTATLPSLDFGNMLRAGLITALRFTGSRLPEHSTAGQLLEALSGAFAEKWGMRPLSEAANVIEEVRTGGKAYEDLGFQESFSRSLGYGVGQALEDVGSALQWKGKQDLGEMIEAAGRAVSAGKRVEGYTPEQEQKMGVKVWLKPKYWATTQAASLPIQAPLMAAAIAPTVAGGALGGPLGTAVGATAGAAISRPAESYLEAGQAYTEAKRLGYDEEIARKVADMVFKENLKIGVADIPELAALFAPIPSPLAKGAATPLKRAMLSLGVGGAKVGGAAIKEAAEEFAQERIQSQALAREPHSFAEDIVRFAQPSTWTPEEASAALAGGFMGALFGGTGVATDVARAVRPQRVVDTEGASVESEAIEGTTIEGLDAIENKLVTEYGKLLDKGMVDQLINVKQAIPEAEKKYGANSWQAWQTKDTRTALVAEMYKNVMSELDSQLAEAQQENNAEAIKELQKRRDDLEQTAPQRLKDLVTEMQQREAELATAAVPQQAVQQGQAVPQGQIVPQEEVKPAEQSVLQGQAVPQEEVKPAEESVKPIEEPTTEIQVGKQYLVTYKGQTYTGEVIKAGKANAIIRTTDGKQLTIPTKARWAEIEVTGEQMQEEEKAEEKKEAVTATYIVNEEQNTVEVKFSDKPAKEILDRLYTAGFKYSRKNKTWYAEQTPERIALAKELAKEETESKSEAEPETKPEEKPEAKPEEKPKTKLEEKKEEKKEEKAEEKKEEEKKKEEKKEEEKKEEEKKEEEKKEEEKKEEEKKEEEKKEEEKKEEEKKKEKSEAKPEIKPTKEPEKKPEPEQVVAPKSLQELLEQITAASPTEIGQEQAEALGVLIRGVASYRGLSPDEYVRQRFSGVVKGGEPAENALFKRMELDDKNISNEPAGKDFKEPKKTIKAYKMFRTLKSRPGEIFPLFIGKTKPTPIGKWIPAEFLPTKGYAQRPGWHAGVLPYAPHLMKKDGTMPADRVWAEVELPADVDWQSVADKSKTRDIRDAIPEGGYYRFKTNKMQGGAWLIGGAIKVNRILSLDEVRSIVKEHGIDVQFKVIDGVPVAAVEFNEDAKALIRALKAPTVADMAHELGHVFRRDLSAKDLAIIEDWAGVLDGAWTVEAEEKFADGFVEYLAEGRAPNENLRGVFEKFKRWITKIFENISKRTKVELSDPVREVFDRLVGGKELEKKPKPEEPKTKPEKLSNLEQQLTEKGVEYTKDVDGSLIIGKGIVWAKDKWDRDVPARGSVGVHASSLIMAPKIAFKKVSDRFYVSKDKKYGVRKEEDGTWSALQFKDKDRSGEYETDLLWDGASTAKEAATYIEEYVVDKEGKPPTYFFELESSFSDKDVVKKLGAKWGPQVNRKEKSWFLPTNKLMDLLDAFDNVYISRAAVEMLEKSLKEEPKAKKAKTEEVSEESQLDASVRIAKFVTNSLKSKEKFDSRQLFNVANEAYGGTQAEGKYTPKDAYDAMELGVNTYILERGFNSDIDSLGLAADTLEMIEEDILAMIPTQTKRTEEQEAFQQFSTPPNIAFVAAWAANIKPGETVLEPSAGVGGLAVFAKNAGAKVVVNELSERRAKLLKELDFDKVFTENAEQIDNILPDDIKPTVVLMNPPFSATAGRMGQKKATQFAKRHVEQALSRLEPNGRLVAILGRGMADSTATFRDWWAEIKKEYNVLANITIEGANYRKYGTTFDIQLVIIDKTGPTTKKTLTGTVTDLDDILPILEGIRNDRTSVDRQVELAPSKSDSEETSSETEGEARPGHAIHLPTDGVGTGQPSAATSGAVEGLRDGIIRPEGITGHPDMSNRPTASTGRPDKGRPERGSEVDQSEGAGEIEAGSGSGVRTAPTTITETVDGTRPGRIEESEITVEQIEQQVQEEEEPGSIYAKYKPQKVKIPGAKPHPGDLVQSAAMAAVEPPAPTYVPNLPKNIIEEGKLSDAQLEAIVYAGQNFEKFLPNGMRKGFFIGDGTGVGKGREISGIILDSMRQGQTKAVWVSKVTDLIKDAKRDFGNIGGDSKLIFEHQKTKAGDSIRAKDGILFTTYTTLGWDLNVTASGDLTVKKGKHSRIDQVVEWLGKDFEGVIVFDEAHEMCNCMMRKKKIGKTKPAAKALAGIELARRLPKARVVYLSATGGVEVSDLGYAERLGLWGKDTAFANKEDFVDKISAGGIAAMELVARDMKAMGDYISRNLSYEGVTFETLEHQLDDNQTEMYDTMARAWQVVLQNIEKAIEETGAKRNGTAKRNAYSQFWGAQQRFFNQVLTSMQMPSVIKAIKTDLKNGRSVILQIVNTNFAAQERALAKKRSRGDDIEDLDLTPRGTLIEFLKKSFPVQQYEEFMDEDGNVLSRPVFDSQGNPVLNKHAVAMRDDLIERLGSMRIPDGPLEMLLNVFGKDNVAEVTGRTRRVVQVIDEETGKKKPIIESRSVNHRRADVQAFMDGKKRILVFSEAGGTGASYHADRAAKNQQPRTHYLLQAGWSATKAMQGFGRSHRSNQAHPPHYVLVTTNLKGHRRFISTIARRLDQLGALTKGQRQAGSQGLFRASDNLESDIAKDALDVFYRNLVANRIEGLDGYDVLKRLGLDKALLDQRGSLKDAPDRRETAKFLNRILVLESELQNKVFDVYFGTVEAMTQKAIENGTLDIGMEDYRRDKIEVINEKTVYTEPESGAETKYIELNAGDKTRPISFKAAKGIKNLMGFYQNKRSKRVYAIADSGYKTTLENGHVVRMLKRYGQEYSSTELINEEEFTKQLKSGAYIELTPEQAEPLWNEAYEKIPEYKMEKVHLISGVLLPIWDRLPQTRMRVVRIRTDEGHVFLGRIVPAKSINTVLHNLGADLVEIKRTHQDIFKAILEDGESFKLVNGWELKRRRVANEYRIELIGDDLWKFKEELFEAGVFTEEIDYKVRYFIPVSDKGADVIKQITARRPIVTDVPVTSTESLDDVLDRFKDKVNETMPGEPPKGGFSIYDVSRYERRKAKEPAKVERKQFTFDDPEIEKRWQAAKLPKETFLDNIKEFCIRSWHQLSRKYEHLPDNAEFAELHTALDRLESARSVVRYKVYSMQQGITIKLDDYTMDLFTRYVVLADMKEDVAIRKAENEPIGKPIIDEETGDIIEYELPFGFTEESLERNFERLNQEIEKYPEIKEAVKDRKDVWGAIVNDYVKAMADIGFHVENRFRRKNYFHRMVIEYVAAKRLGIRGTGKAIEKGSLKGRGFLKARKGSSLDFNTDYVTAEYEVMAQMLYDIEVAKAIKLVEEEYNQRRSLEREAKRRNQAAIDKIIQEEIKQYGIGNSPLENELKALDQKMAMSFSQLQEMAEYNKLWTGDDGEWSTAVDELAQGERDTTYERSRMMNYLAALADKENEGLPGNLQARTIFKAIQERKDLIEETLGDKFVTFKDIIPEGYVLHRIEKGHIFYFAHTIPEHLVDQITDKMLEEIQIPREYIRQVKAVASVYPAMVVKEEVSLTLENFKEDPLDNVISQAAVYLTRPWKIYVLTAPHRWYKYNLRNISGDAEAVFVGNPSAFKKVPQAVTELYEVMFKDRPMSSDMREAFERGLFQILQQSVEIGDLDKLSMFEHLYEKEQRYEKYGKAGKLITMPTKAWQTYWKYARLSTDFREAILRYACFLDYLEQIRNNPEGKPKNFGASMPENVMALKNPYDRAFKLSNELCGAYNRVGVIGQHLRKSYIPFWSWNEVNFRRNLQLWKNIWNEAKFSQEVGRKLAGMVGRKIATKTIKIPLKIAKVPIEVVLTPFNIMKSPLSLFNLGKVAIAMFKFWAILTVWNYLIFRDEEEDLPKDVRYKPHIIFGRDKDGNVMYLDRLGVLEDFLEWFGLDDAGIYIYEHLNGRRTFRETIKDMVIAPFDKLAQGFMPLLKIPAEAAIGTSVYPSITEKRHIYDGWEYLAEQFGFKGAYKAMTGKPREPYYKSAEKWFTSVADPRRTAYFEIRDLSREYRKEVLKKNIGEGYFASSRSDVLYNIKQAIQLEDIEAFKKYLQEYIMLGGTAQDLEKSLKSQDPLYGLKGDALKDFYNNYLNPEEQAKVNLAVEYYYEVLLRKGDKRLGKAVDEALKELEKEIKK